MIFWFIAEDNAYYQNFSLLCKEYNLRNLILFPNIEEIKNAIEQKSVAFIAPYPPPKEIYQFFTIKTLPNKYGILTTQEYQSNVPESKALEARLGLSVIDSPFTLQDIGGATALKKYTAQLLRVEQQSYKAKGVF